jgi:hypothetical protein
LRRCGSAPAAENGLASFAFNLVLLGGLSYPTDRRKSAEAATELVLTSYLYDITGVSAKRPRQ